MQKKTESSKVGLEGNRTDENSEIVKQAHSKPDAVNDTTSKSPSASEPSQMSPNSEETEKPSEANAIQVLINSDHNIHSNQSMNRDIEDTVNASLSRFGEQITRVEIHLSDDNGSKSHGDDKRCLLEARPAGHQPLVVTAVAATVYDAVNESLEKMERLLESTFEKINAPKGRSSLGGDLSV